MPDVSFEIKGLKELNRELKQLPEDFRTKALNTAVRNMANVIKDQAVENAPKASGFLASSIKTKIAPKKSRFSKYISRYIVRPSKNAYYAHMIEDGTVKQPAQPFMRPAFMAKKEAAVRKFREVLDRRIFLANRKIKSLQK